MLKKLVRNFRMLRKHINIKGTKYLSFASQQERVFAAIGSPHTRLTSVSTPPPTLQTISIITSHIRSYGCVWDCCSFFAPRRASVWTRTFFIRCSGKYAKKTRNLGKYTLFKTPFRGNRGSETRHPTFIKLTLNSSEHKV